MARTTLDLDDAVLRELKRRRERERRPIGTIASELLARALAEGEHEHARESGWRAARMGEPRVDIEDKDALWKALDRE